MSNPARQVPEADPQRAAPLTRSPAAVNPGRPQDAAIRVLCVDDHRVLVEGLKTLFAIEGRIGVVGYLPSAEDLLSEVSRLRPDVVLLDIEMPGPDVFEMADRLRHMHANVRVIFLSAHIRDGYIGAAYRCRAWGYFAKSDDLEAIAAGVVEVARSIGGTFVLGPKVRQRCRPLGGAAGSGRRGAGARVRPLPAGQDDAPPKTLLDSLSPREVEVLRLVGKGLSRNEIAAQLSRSAKTVDGHRERIMKKLDLHTQAELVRFAIREGLAEA